MAYVKKLVTTGGGSGIVNIESNGTLLPAENTLNFVGSAANVVDNPGNMSTDVNFNPKLNQIASSTLSKGVLFTSDGSVVTTVAVGTNDSYLVADSTQASGIRWESAYNTIEEEGTPISQRDKLNFIGSAYTVSDDAPNSRTNVTAADNINDIASLTLAKGSLLVDDGVNIVNLAVGLNNYILTADSGQASGVKWANPTAILTSAQNVIYVAKNGNDTTGTGSVNLPYLTVQKALSVVTAPTTNNVWVIDVGPGRYAETGDIVLPPFTYICGYGGTASYITSTTNQIIPSSLFNSGSARCGLINMYVGGSTAINFDLVTYALGGNSCVFIMENTTVNGAITMKGRVGNADFIQAYVCTTFGNLTMSTANLQAQDCIIAGDFIMDTAASLANSTGTMVATQVSGNISVTSSGAQTTGMQFFGSNVIGTATFDAAGTTVTSDDVSLPALKTNLSITNGATLILSTDCYGTKYAPAVPGNWSPAPDNVSDALDQLAANSGSGSSITWSVVTANTPIVKDNGYFSNGAALVFTLPATAAVGDTFEISNIGTAFSVAQNAGQSIRFGNQITTTGVGGSLASTAIGDSLRIVCRVANTGFQVVSSMGEITYV